MHPNLPLHFCVVVSRNVSRPSPPIVYKKRKMLTALPSAHWIVPIIGTAFFAPGFYLTFQSILNYLGESYPRYVASVFAGNTFFRSSFGGALPLAAPQMRQSLGIGWASSILGFISVAMVPLPFILERVSSHVFVLQESGGTLANCCNSTGKCYDRRASTQTRCSTDLFFSYFCLALV